MQSKLFESIQILLFVGSVSMGDEPVVQRIIHGLGFNDSVYIDGKEAMPTRNLYSGFFEGRNEWQIIEKVKEELYRICSEENVGMVDFFLIDATKSTMFKSIWHDGFY